MRVLPILLLAATGTVLPPANRVVAAETAPSCRHAALAQLRRVSPEGHATFLRAADPAAFDAWIDCDDAQYGLPTAVHEATHLESAETDTFALVGGGAVARPHEVSAFFPPARVADRFAPDDFTRIYLQPGRASAATDALYLLDEFNAYTHDLAAAVDLEALARPDEAVDHRDGLAAMMAFVAAYAEAARAGEPETWRGLRAPRVAGAVRRLWASAERVMASSCGIPRFGTRDRLYLRPFCEAGRSTALGAILGREPACAAACLDPDPAAKIVSEEAEAPAPNVDAFAVSDEPRVARHPFAIAAGPRRHRSGPEN